MGLFIKGATEIAAIMKNHVNTPPVAPNLVKLNPPEDVTPEGPGETPPSDVPPGETPPEDVPPGETPPSDTPPGETPPPEEPPAPINPDKAVNDFIEEIRNRINSERWEEITKLESELTQNNEKIDQLRQERAEVAAKMGDPTQMGDAERRVMQIDAQANQLIKRNEAINQELAEIKDVDRLVRRIDQIDTEQAKLNADITKAEANAGINLNEDPALAQLRVGKMRERLAELATERNDLAAKIKEIYDAENPPEVTPPETPAEEQPNDNAEDEEDDGVERAAFESASISEQDARRQELLGMFEDSEDSAEPGDFADFLGKAKGDPSRIQIENLNEGETVADAVERCAQANDVIEAALKYYDAIVRDQEGDTTGPELGDAQAAYEDVLGTNQELAPDGQLDIEQLVAAYDFGLDLYANNGGAYGSTPGEINKANQTADLEAILRLVNEQAT